MNKKEAFETLVRLATDNEATTPAELEIFRESLHILMPCTEITFVTGSIIIVDEDTGKLISYMEANTLNSPNVKPLNMIRKSFQTASHFDSIKWGFAYIQSVRFLHYAKNEFDKSVTENESGLCLHINGIIPEKTNVSFTVNENVRKKFLEVTDELAINKSKWLENEMRKLIGLAMVTPKADGGFGLRSYMDNL